MAETSDGSSSEVRGEVNCYNYNCSGTFSMQAGVIHKKKIVSDIATVILCQNYWHGRLSCLGWTFSESGYRIYAASVYN